MSKSHGVGWYSDKDRRRVRRSYKKSRDYQARFSNPKNNNKERYVREDYNED